MKHLKVFLMVGVISSLCSNLVWAGEVGVTEVDESRNALISVSLCGEGAALGDMHTATEL